VPVFPVGPALLRRLAGARPKGAGPLERRVETYALAAAACLTVTVLALWLLAGNSSAPARPTSDDQAPRIAVAASKAETRTLTVSRIGLGSAQASNTVQVTSRVDGQVVKLGFREGQDVREGDLIAQIDPRPYEASLRQLQAQLRSNEARLTALRGDLARLGQLRRSQNATQQAFDAKQAEVAQAEASSEATQADIDRAKLQLDYTSIKAPISGRIGLRQIDVGNVIMAGERTPIATITQVRPISVVFSLPQDDLPLVSRALASGRPIAVEAVARDNRSVVARGTLVTIDSLIDAKTGTFKLKADFDNESGELWPGQFVKARILLDTRENVTVVPSVAVQAGPAGPFVYTVDELGTAKAVPVTTGQSQDDVTAIEAGLAPGDTIIVEGQHRLQPGSPVLVREGRGDEAGLSPPLRK
jgi:membrane fusion protein, multidrug efflux system